MLYIERKGRSGKKMMIFDINYSCEDQNFEEKASKPELLGTIVVNACAWRFVF